MSKSLSHVLVTPIQFDQETITIIEIARLKGKYARGVKMGGAGDVSFGTLMEVAEAALAEKWGTIKAHHVIDELDGEDLQAVLTYVGEWLAGDQQTTISA